MIKTLLIICLWTSSIFSQSWLNTLNAGKNSPLFTTYAAAKERSEFVIDQGYQFLIHQTDRPLSFLTDKGGMLNLLFKMDGRIVHALRDYYRQPIIKKSYNYMVEYYCYPFQGIRVNGTFLVQSSRTALHKIIIMNENTGDRTVDVIPYYYQNNDYVTNTEYIDSTDAFYFFHREQPDGWVTSHGVPYQEYLLNLFDTDKSAAAYGCYLYPGSLPTPSAPEQEYCLVQGNIYHSDSSLCLHSPDSTSMLVFLNGNENEVLTELSGSMPGDGTYQRDLGGFTSPAVSIGDTFNLHLFCAERNLSGRKSGTVTELPDPDGIQTDVTLSDTLLYQPPQNFDLDIAMGNTSVYISWSPVPGLLYNIYRRTASTEGRYSLVTQSTSGGYFDTGLNSDSSYAYIIVAGDSSGNYSPPTQEKGSIIYADEYFLNDVQNEYLSNKIPDDSLTKVTALQHRFQLSPGTADTLITSRSVTAPEQSISAFTEGVISLYSENIQTYIERNEAELAPVPDPGSVSDSVKALYWSSVNLLEQCFLPPEGQLSYNYYVFSREPQWGWGHGGQVFHESLAMLAWVYMDPVSAMNSQRVYMETQAPDGYINYRTGAYLSEQIPNNGDLTSSAPWFNWINYELFRVTGDRTFLADAYNSGKAFYQWWEAERDDDNDGLYEWGGTAIFECVRDGWVASWQVAPPENMETPSLNSMMYKEALSLAAMADSLGLTAEADQWRAKASELKSLINSYMWDPVSGFYFNIDKSDNDFHVNSTDDCKRFEIIGFLPLWAGVADSSQAAAVVSHLLNPDKFWRPYGIPGAAADDPYYDPHGYWNGPVWIQWQYLIFRGLTDYGYYNEARELAYKLYDQMIYQLQVSKNFWEHYSPDDRWAGHNYTYIWSGIIARMIYDMQNVPVGLKKETGAVLPSEYSLSNNYPNPFNPETRITFTLPRTSHVELTVYNTLGERTDVLINEKMQPGRHNVSWRPEGLSSGIYICVIKAAAQNGTHFREAVKMVYLK